MTTAPAWEDVMAGLRGARLAVFDDLLRLGIVEYERLCSQARKQADVTAAVEWLASHRFIVRDESEQWRARPVSEARRIFEERGPIQISAPAAATVPTIEPVRYQVPIQPHQSEFFALEGYRQ